MESTETCIVAERHTPLRVPRSGQFPTLTGAV